MEKWKFFTLKGLELPPSLFVQPVASRYTAQCHKPVDNTSLYTKFSS
jgi:hypothetical protein